MKITKFLLLVCGIGGVYFIAHDEGFSMDDMESSPHQTSQTDPLYKNFNQRPTPVYSPPIFPDPVFESKPRPVSRPTQPPTQRSSSSYVSQERSESAQTKQEPVATPSSSISRPAASAESPIDSTARAPYVSESTHYSSLDILPISEDEQVRRGLAAFLDEGTDIARLPAAFRKGLESRDVESYFSDGQTKAFSADEQLAGCLVHLIAQGKTSSLRELFDNPNWKLWVYLAQKIGIKTTCLDVVRSLHGAKQVFLSSPHHGQLSGLAEGFINTALTKIFYGCWGISSEPTEPDVMRELKGIARNLGSGRNRSLYATVNQVVGSYDQYNPASVEDRLQEHYLAVAHEIAEGSVASQPLKNRFISMFESRGFSPDLVQKTLGSLRGGDVPLPKSPISGLMVSLLTDSQLRKNISEEKDRPRLTAILSDYTNAALTKLYGFISCAGFNFKKEKQFLKTHMTDTFISALPSSTKMFCMFGEDPLYLQAIDSLSEGDIQDAMRQAAPLQNSILTVLIDRNDVPTWLRLVLLKNKRGLTKQEASVKALAIIQAHDRVIPVWRGLQKATLGTDFMRVITLYDHICQISKPCTNADFMAHKPFFDFCLTRAKSSELDFETKRDVFRWLRGLKGPNGSTLNIQIYQTGEVIPAIEAWSKEALSAEQRQALEGSSKFWFEHPIEYEKFSYGEFEPLRDLIEDKTPYPEDPRSDSIERMYSVVDALLGVNILRFRQDGIIEDYGWNKYYKKMRLNFHPDKHNTKPWVKEAEKAFQNIAGLNTYVIWLYTNKANFHKIRRLYNEKLEREQQGDFS